MRSRIPIFVAVLVAIALVGAAATSARVVSPFAGGRYHFNTQTEQGTVPFQWSYVFNACEPNTARVTFTLTDGMILGGGGARGGFVTTFFFPGKYTVRVSYYCVADGAVTAEQQLDQLAFRVGPGLKPPRTGFGRDRCGNVRGAIVLAQSLGCTPARVLAGAMLRGRTPAGHSCLLSGGSILACGRGGNAGTNMTMPSGKVADVVTVIPGGAANCSDLLYGSRRYAVSAKGVTCQYASGNARRALMGERPVIAEFVDPPNGPLWRCEVYGAVAGICVKRSEDRVLAWQLKN